MLKIFDLGMEEEYLESMLNDPEILLTKCSVFCGETGFTTVSVDMEKAKEPIKRKRHRKLKRFLMFNGGNRELDEILENPINKIIHKYEFMTKQGVIIVLDYEYL